MDNTQLILEKIGIQIDEDQLILKLGRGNKKKIIELKDISSINIAEAKVPFQRKLFFWFYRIIFSDNRWGITGYYDEDLEYRNLYSLVIKLRNRKSISKYIRNFDLINTKNALKMINNELKNPKGNPQSLSSLN